MSTYAIGDIQGCYAAFQALLAKIQFNDKTDRLWLVGDLVNRGPQSLEVLRFVYNHRHLCRVVLGNHDLHLLACYYGKREVSKTDTLTAILTASDKNSLIDYLKAQPLIHSNDDYIMVHAGVAPQWSLTKAHALSKEIETVLQSNDAPALLAQMYGNEPNLWHESLSGMARYRCIINYFTRMRYCNAAGELDLDTKGNIAKSGYMPWFNVPKRALQNDTIVFGHWAALGGKTHHPKAIALDTGMVWGGSLTALRLEDSAYFSVDAKNDLL